MASMVPLPRKHSRQEFLHKHTCATIHNTKMAFLFGGATRCPNCRIAPFIRNPLNGNCHASGYNPNSVSVPAAYMRNAKDEERKRSLREEAERNQRLREEAELNQRLREEAERREAERNQRLQEEVERNQRLREEAERRESERNQRLREEAERNKRLREEELRKRRLLEKHPEEIGRDRRSRPHLAPSTLSLYLSFPLCALNQ